MLFNKRYNELRGVITMQAVRISQLERRLNAVEGVKKPRKVQKHVCGWCKDSFKNERGLAIHRGRTHRRHVDNSLATV